MVEQEAGQGGGIPYIGSLISLVSASGQRYRGTLYTVDLNESTIALQNGGHSLAGHAVQGGVADPALTLPRQKQLRLSFLMRR